MNRWDLRFKLSLDGRRAYLLRGSVREVSITWSDKSGAFNIIFHNKLHEAAWTRDQYFINFFAELFSFITAYKKDADKLEQSRQALELVINK